MKIWWLSAMGALLFVGCAGSRSEHVLPECSAEIAFARGHRDALAGHNAETGFVNTCAPDSRSSAREAYRAGWAAAHPRNAPEAESKEDLDESDPLSLAPSVREPAATPSWICEVEASSKIFTGVGATREEALGSARESCGSHLQSNACGQADCKKAL